MKKYCKYCEEESLYGECNKDVVKTKMKLNGIPFNEIEVFVEGTDLILCVMDYDAASCYEYKRVKIKYCPMCGKKLTKNACEERV